MTSVIEKSQALHQKVRGLIERGRVRDASELDDLGLEILRFQTAHVAPVRRLAEARSIDIDRIENVDDFPAVPCDVFRLKRVAAHSPDLDVRVFRTSGTTSGARGEHCFRDLDTYRTAALAMGAPMLWSDARPSRVISLAPKAIELVDSSLSFMIDLFAEHLGVTTTHHLGAGGIDWDGLSVSLEEARREGGPVLLFGTSFAFVYLLDGSEGRDLSLPPRSRLMLTGGFKGRSREVSQGELRDALSRKLSIDPDLIIGEYGMTELSSQLYEPRLAGGGQLYEAPFWTRVTAVDPITFAPLPDGEVGLCKIVDLANVDSAIAIQTLDRVRVTEGRVELLGRAKDADLRGCSLTVEEIADGDHA